jgi:hypothetical protein
VHLQRDNKPMRTEIVWLIGVTMSLMAGIRARTVQPYIYVSLKA